MYYDNFPSLSEVNYNGNLRYLFDRACELYGLCRDEFIARLVFDARATPSTMRLAIWGLNNLSPRKLSQMRLRYNDPRFREVPNTIVSEVSFLSMNGTKTKFDTTGLDVDEIIELLQESLCK
ncbi:MAG: hypothetical protein ACRDBG_28005 [Waterburya sp.]